MSISINRILDLKKIKAIGLDMDHTAVRYNSTTFEQLTYNEMVKKLIDLKGYPQEVSKLPFDFDRVIRGLVIDRKNGNLIKLSIYSRVKLAYHGTTQLDYKTLNKLYRGMVVDLGDKKYRSLDTTFSISEAVLFQGLVQLSEDRPELQLPDFETMAEDINQVLDLSHRDGSTKGEVAKDLAKYIVQDPTTVSVLEKLKAANKTLMIITNSDFAYTKLLLDYTINPFLKNHKSWQELFTYTIASSSKPAFFTDNRDFFAVNPDAGTLTPVQGQLAPGIYHGGNANLLQKSLGFSGEEILYLGDHIFGDILQLKKLCNWRTALVVEELTAEIQANNKVQSLMAEIDLLMQKKEVLELEINALPPSDKKSIKEKMASMYPLDNQIGKLISTHQSFFNPYWGEVMRAGQEESRYMGQVSKYACIYMSKISDFADYSAQHYFRPRRRPLPHES